MKESEIRPENLIKEYKKLVREDIENYFNHAGSKKISCVACDSSETETSFIKNAFPYCTCKNCGTLFQSPRANEKIFTEFYKYSKSSDYWNHIFFPAVAEKRRKSIFLPRVERVTKICDSEKINVKKLIEVGAGYGLFLEEWRKKNPKVLSSAIEPSPVFAKRMNALGINAEQKMLSEIDFNQNNNFDLVISFEVLEHVFNPKEFISDLFKLCKPGGIILLSSLTIDGFDLSILGEESEQIYPPFHINFFSLKGIEILFKSFGISSLNITTPGKLDTQIVARHFKKNDQLALKHKFINSILKNDENNSEFQKFLSTNKLSSHFWVYCIKD
ncbi:MAG: SAM-dependent methyltransferase [Euryarchaeota archaeon]|nr:SAM-dependent methyltransferase [Euryarchaeota archaeon]|tara:strand:- start:28768 stop:29757 length:990 start_codon:yes stop_codon:yes gene_type:complete